jgi:hypothetical protein
MSYSHVYIYWCPTHIMLCFCFIFLRLVYPMLPVSLDCPFFIAPSVFSNLYLKRRIHFQPSPTNYSILTDLNKYKCLL